MLTNPRSIFQRVFPETQVAAWYVSFSQIMEERKQSIEDVATAFKNHFGYTPGYSKKKGF